MKITSNTKLSSILLMVISNLLLFTTYSCSNPSSDKISIGDKQFLVTTMEKGKPETGTMEQMVFTDSLFDNLQCHEWGFTACKYTAKKAGDGINFEAIMPSTLEGKMTWTGKIMGDKIEGDMVWQKEGQADIQYTFKGTTGTLPEKKEISLDGKIYFTNTMEHGKPETAYDEDWIFEGGKLRSPSCEEYGFFKSPYKAMEQNGIIMMESVFQSTKNGHMNFTATIRGDKLKGNVVWIKEGQNTINYDVTGMLKK